MLEYFDFLSLALILVGILIWWYGTIPKNIPPGPKGLPIIGCFPKVTASNAHLRTEEWSRKYGPVLCFYQFTRPVVVLSDYEMIQEALAKQQGDTLHGKPQFAPFKGKPPRYGLLQAEGALWKEQRRFALSTLRDFGLGRPIMENTIALEANELLQSINDQQGKSFDPQGFLSTAISNAICSLIFGHRFEKGSKLKMYLDELNFRLSQSQTNNLSMFNLFPWIRTALKPFSRKLRRIVQGGEEMVGFMQDEIDLARKNYDPRTSIEQAECLVHAYDKAVANNDGEYFTDVQLLAMITDLFLAGSDTTTTTMRWALFYMSSNPDIQEKVHKEILDQLGQDEFPSYSDRTKLPFTEATLMEIHRCATILPLSVPHRAMENTKFLGYSIPKDAIIIPSLWAVHRDPRHFHEPNKFNPYRFLDDHGNVRRNLPLIPFSAGKRVCLGESLARMEVFLLFTSLMQKFQFTFASDAFEQAGEFVGFLRSPAKFEVYARKHE